MRIVGQDNFLDMPLSTQALYFHLGMYADDDGFVNPNKILRMSGANADDLKILQAKAFVIPFKSGVIVVTHWKENNYIQKDRYQSTLYKEEMAQLGQDKDGVYILDTQVRLELGKDIGTSARSPVKKQRTENEGFDAFWTAWPKKVAKEDARKAWNKIVMTPGEKDRILAAIVERAKTEEWVKRGGQFIPYPATWLNGRRWEDELPGVLEEKVGAITIS